MNPCDNLRRKEYIDFYRLVRNSKLSEGDVLRMYRTFDQLILKIVESEKFFISVDCGILFPQLFDVSFACDYRIISSSTTIENTYLKFGLLPKGGAAYFLKKQLGHNKAFEILLSSKGINANEGLQLGIVNKVVPFEKLEEASILSAKQFAKLPATTLSGIKRFLNYSMKDLADYLEFENNLLINILEPFTWDFK
jgi:2-(1,2-epoxy-1,2-dihydrophenyl)acetyl-CoA isomerase